MNKYLVTPPQGSQRNQKFDAVTTQRSFPSHAVLTTDNEFPNRQLVVWVLLPGQTWPPIKRPYIALLIRMRLYFPHTILCVPPSHIVTSERRKREISRRSK